jgi:hypothetical protein
MRRLCLHGVLVLTCFSAFGQVRNIVTNIKKTVTFIELQCVDGTSQVDVRGTGFFVF